MIEGDIKGYFDNINHQILASMLKRHFTDTNIIDFYWKLVKAGYINDGQYEKSSLGVPQGGVISPLLSNLYLHDFDLFMEGIITKYSFFDKRVSKHNPRYGKLSSLIKKISGLSRKVRTSEQNAILQEYQEEFKKTPSMIRTDDTGTRVYYNRYADDWLVGISGPKSMAEDIKFEIKNFLSEKLLLKLSDDKTKITHVESDKALYLGFSVFRKSRMYTESLKSFVKSTGNIRRASNSSIIIEAPIKKIIDKLIDQKYASAISTRQRNIARQSSNPGRLSVKPHAITKWIFLSPEEIVLRYNAVIRGILNYYSAVENRNQLSYIT